MAPREATDVLGIVYRFVQEYAQSPPTVPMLNDNQIIRGWQGLGVIPAVSEVCILTLVSSIRHGTNAHSYIPEEKDLEVGAFHIEKMVEHIVQVDFAALSQAVPPHVTKTRADVFESVANSQLAARIFRNMSDTLSCMYCDDVMSLGELDGAHSLRHRHKVTLHISERQQHDLPMSGFNSIALKTKCYPGNTL